MTFLGIKVFLIFSLCFLSLHSKYVNNTSDAKSGKVFSLFSVVQFPNDVCTSNSATFNNGTCVTSSECTSRGGTSQGTCAAGFGVCCVFTFSSTSTVTRNTSYLVNPSYPSNYAPTSTPTTITYTIQKESCDVCRLRLDYETFQLTAASTAHPFGQCITEYMALTTTAHTVTPASTGNYGNYPMLCGTNDGLHSYIDLSCTCADEAKVAITVKDTTDNLWKIKVTQLSCDDPEVSRQEGCFQYFTGETGTIESYGLQSSGMLAQMNYGICIRPESGHCCIEYTPTTWDVFAGSDSAIGTAVAVDCGLGPGAIAADTLSGTTRCTGAKQCWQNWVNIPGAQSPVTSITQAAITMYAIHAENGAERYCGTMLIPTGMTSDTTNTNRLNPVTTCQRPFRLHHVTGAVTSGDTGQTAVTNSATATFGGVGVANTDGNEGATGFKMTFRQIPGSC